MDIAASSTKVGSSRKVAPKTPKIRKPKAEDSKTETRVGTNNGWAKKMDK